MPDSSDLTHELVELLTRGCTVVELIRRCRDVLGDDRPTREWAEAVRRAFGLGLGGWYSLAATESFGSGRMPDSKLTWVFLPEILANRPAWDTDANREPAWFDGFEKTPFEELEKAVGDRHGLSPEGWAALGEADRGRVRNMQANLMSHGEDIQLLAALAERLQRRVNELEQQPATVGHGTTEQQPT
jgi:hypothetical protein